MRVLHVTLKHHNFSTDETRIIFVCLVFLVFLNFFEEQNSEFLRSKYILISRKSSLCVFTKVAATHGSHIYLLVLVNFEGYWKMRCETLFSLIVHVFCSFFNNNF